MTRMVGPDCAVMCNLINTHTQTRAHTWEEAPPISPKLGKHGNEESYGKVQGSAGEGRHGICGMPRVLARRHDGGPPVEGDLRQEPGVVWCGGTCWWDVSWQ